MSTDLRGVTGNHVAPTHNLGLRLRRDRRLLLLRLPGRVGVDLLQRLLRRDLHRLELGGAVGGSVKSLLSMMCSGVKSFSIGERLNIGIRADATNLTNTPQFDSPGTDLATKATFGIIQTAGPGRSVQLALRAVF